MEGESASIPDSDLGETLIENSENRALESASVADADTVKNTHNTNKTQSEAQSDAVESLFGSNYCSVCGAVLQSESRRVSHYEGKKHAQKVRQYLQKKKDEARMNNEFIIFQEDGSTDQDRFCQLCNMVFSSPVVAKSHYRGKVHAKNLRKQGILSTALTGDSAPQGSPLAPSLQEDGGKQQEVQQAAAERSPGPAPAAAAAAAPQVETVDLSDPNKHCRLCAATFNNPLMAQQHYSGRKHQRNQARCKALKQMQQRGEPGVCLDSQTFTCPVCNVTLNSVEMYQSHMQGNKHQQKEMKVADMISKSQMKAYDSFQDELADYIQVQRARGLEPRALRPEGREEEEEGEGEVGEEEEEEEPLLTRLPPPTAHFRPPSWRPSFPAPSPQRRFEGPPSRGRGYPPMAPPLTTAGVRVRSRGREARNAGYAGERARRKRSGRDLSTSSDSSSYSSSSSSSSSTNSSSSSDDHGRRERRRKKRWRKESGRRTKEVDSGEDEKRREGRRSRQKERRRRRSGGRKREEGHQPKRRRRREVEERDEVKEERGEPEMEPVEEPLEIEPPPPEETKETAKEREKEGRHKREKKRKKEKREEMDTRTEEEKLWDETILGLV
ncbi:hypothetical protein GJAV_G00049230 [Gymnothorax javanicus]|nr:hypothetical protein GJAV_G00049230 [Gymnothorax javanicus]